MDRPSDDGTQPQHGTVEQGDAMTEHSTKYLTPQQRREYVASSLRTKVRQKADNVSV
jgi:hypothetical protein